MKRAIVVGLILIFQMTLTSMKAQEQKPELVVQNGHTAAINSIAFSPDSKVLVSGSSDESLIFWDVETGKQLRIPSGQSKSINTVAFSPDGKFIASGSDSGIVKLLDAKGKELQTIDSEDGDPVYSVTFSPDGKFFVINADLNWLWIFKRQGAVYKSSKLGDSFSDFQQVVSTEFSPDGKNIAIAESTPDDLKVSLVKIANGQILRTFHTNCFSFSPDWKIIALGDDKNIMLRDVATGKAIIKFTEASSGTSLIAFNSDGKTIASIGDDNTLKFWDVANGKKIKTLIGHSKRITSIVFSPNGKILASTSEDKTIKLWDVERGKELRTLTGHTSSIGSLTMNQDGKLIASSNGDKKIRLWSITDGKGLSTIFNFIGEEPTGDSSPYSLIFNPDGKTLTSASKEVQGENDKAIVRQFDVVSGKELKKFPLSNGSDVESLGFSYGGKILAKVRGGRIEFTDVETGEETKEGFDLEVSSWSSYYQAGAIAFSSSGDKFAFGNFTFGIEPQYKIEIANPNSGKRIRTLLGHTDWVNAVAFDPTERILVSSSDDKTIRIWNIETGKELKTLKGTFTSVTSLAFSQNGKILISGGRDGRIILWNALTGKELVSLIAINKNDWLVTTPEGYFDGTPAGWKQLIWRFSNNTFDYGGIELYFNDFFYPNLLQDVLAGKAPKPKAGQELEKQDRRQPKVEIASINGQTKSQINASSANQTSTDKQTSSVVVEVTENIEKPKQPNHKPSSEVQDLRLFRNGSLVKIWHGETMAEIVKQNKSDCQLKTAVNNSGRKLVCQTNMSIVAGENNFTAYAFNSSNVKSNDDSVSIKGADSLKKDGTLYVLAIGVNKYANPAYNLNFAVPDVEEIGAALKSQQDKLSQATKLKQYSKTEIITLTDENATKENILRALRRFSEGEKASIPSNASEKLKTELAKIKPTEPEDALIIQFSGHGTSREQRFYLLPHNFTDPKSVTEQAVSDVELNQALEKVDAGRLLMIIDACQSGQALGAKDEGRAPMNSKGLAQLAYDKGMLILTAAQSQQAALEAVKIGNQEIKHGLLTYSLLEAFFKKEADKDSNQQLWEREWFDYATSHVPLLQTEAMKQRRIDLQKGISDVKGKSDLIYLDGDDPNLDPEKRRVQTPRVFYRRETETNPLIVAKP